jgi:putative peptidoglycan binding protein
MARLSSWVVAVSASLAALGFGIATASAQDCKDEVTASGQTRPTESWAKSLATHMWRRQVQATYGEQYEDIKFAKNVNYLCSPASLGKRCTLTATPCIVQGSNKEADRGRDRDGDYNDRSERGLTRDLQRELQRVGCYNGPIDGDWGDGSRRALERFASNRDVKVKTDEPSRRALKAVEEAEKRVCR